jgi:hypothetical protein
VQSAKARNQEIRPSGKLEDLLQTSYGSMEADMYKESKRSYHNPLYNSLTALDSIVATKKTDGRKTYDLLASWDTTKTRSKPAHQGNSASTNWEQKIIPISTLLPPKKTSSCELLEGSCGSLHLHDLDIASTSAETVKRSGNPNSSNHYVPKSTLIRTGSTQALVRRWEEEITRSVKCSPASTTRKNMTCAKMQRRCSTGDTIEWVETVLEP